MSHSSSQAKLVSEIKKHLADYGIDGFVAHEDIEPSRLWQRSILDALRTCHAMALFLTADFHDSFWTDQEVGYALARDDSEPLPGFRRDRVVIVPLRFALNPYGFVAGYQAIDCRNIALAEIPELMIKILIRQDFSLAGSALAQSLADAETPEEAGRRAERLAVLTNLYSDHVQLLADAAQHNPMVARSSTAAGIVARLLQENKNKLPPFDR